MGSSRLADHKAPGGKLVRVRLREEDGRITSVQISGDFFLVPEESLSFLERMLEGTALSEGDVRKRVEQFFEASGARSLGISQEDLVQALISAREEEEVVTV